MDSDKLWNQNGLTIRRLRTNISELPLTRRVQYIGLRDRRKASARQALPAAVFLLFESLGRVPFLREVFCSRVAVELSRPPTPPLHSGGAEASRDGQTSDA